MWKKSEWIEALPIESDDDDDDVSEDVMWKSIPKDELLPMVNIAAAKFKHLLDCSDKTI